jgi:TRAP-type C4-dicarboxylate transport system permease small subunit
MKQQNRVSFFLLGFFLSIGGIALMLMMLYVFGNCAGRALFRTPIMGTIEIAGLAGAVVVSIAVAFAEREKSNVVVDIVTEALPQRTKSVLESLMLVLSLAVLTAMIYAVIEDGIEAFVTKDTSITTGIPLGPFKFVWAAGLLGSWVFMFKHFVEALKKAVKK